MSKEQIKETQNEICFYCRDVMDCNETLRKTCIHMTTAQILYDADYRRRRTGKWKAEGCHYTCSACDKDYMVDACAEDYDPIDYFDLHYCPNCGAKMKVGAE